MTELQSFYPSAILRDDPVPYHVMQKSESSFNSTGSSPFMLYTMNRLLTPQQVVFLLCNSARAMHSGDSIKTHNCTFSINASQI